VGLNAKPTPEELRDSTRFSHQMQT
jgi:hypothetical protein